MGMPMGLLWVIRGTLFPQVTGEGRDSPDDPWPFTFSLLCPVSASYSIPGAAGARGSPLLPLLSGKERNNILAGK